MNVLARLTIAEVKVLQQCFSKAYIMPKRKTNKEAETSKIVDTIFLQQMVDMYNHFSLRKPSVREKEGRLIHYPWRFLFFPERTNQNPLVVYVAKAIYTAKDFDPTSLMKRGRSFKVLRNSNGFHHLVKNDGEISLTKEDFDFSYPGEEEE